MKQKLIIGKVSLMMAFTVRVSANDTAPSSWLVTWAPASVMLLCMGDSYMLLDALL
jgi:hypothetical protein